MSYLLFSTAVMLLSDGLDFVTDTLLLFLAIPLSSVSDRYVTSGVTLPLSDDLDVLAHTLPLFKTGTISSVSSGYMESINFPPLSLESAMLCMLLSVSQSLVSIVSPGLSI